MSALAEALLAAQRQAIAALGKSYLAGTGGEDAREALYEALDLIGCTDKVEQRYLGVSLEYLRELGAASPAAPRANGEPKMISAGQKSYIRDLFRKRNIDPLDDADLNALSNAKASALIEQLQNGTYDPAEYTVPF